MKLALLALKPWRNDLYEGTIEPGVTFWADEHRARDLIRNGLAVSVQEYYDKSAVSASEAQRKQGRGQDWLIAVPAWGPRCLPLLLDVTLPAIISAAERASGNVRFVIHTDQPQKVSKALGPIEHVLRPAIFNNGFYNYTFFGATSRDAIKLANKGEAIAFINADMVPSIELFETAEKRFAQGKRVIIAAGTRTNAGAKGLTPPCGAKSRDLLAWAWQHRHPWVEGCVWGRGKTKLAAVIHFEEGGNVVARGFHLHPFAILNDRDLSFSGPTIDEDLGSKHSRDEIDVITSADDGGFAEMSPLSRDFGYLDRVIDATSVCNWARHRTSPFHRWLFENYRIEIVGDSAKVHSDGHIARQLLDELAKPPSYARPARRPVNKIRPSRPRVAVQ